MASFPVGDEGNESKDVLLQEFEKSGKAHENNQHTVPPEVDDTTPGDPRQPYHHQPSHPQHPRYTGRTESEMGSKYDDEPCCGISLLKYVLFIFNFFLLLAGAGVLAIGVWTLTSKTDYTELLCNNVYYFSVIVLIAAGALIMILAATGCYGAVQEIKGCLLIYFTILLLLCILEIGLSIFLYVFRAQLQVELENCLNHTLTRQYGKEGEEAFTENFDSLHRSFKCCGSFDYQDWKTSYWNASGLAGNRTTPDSCCKSESDYCSPRDHPSNIYRHGCVESLRVYLGDQIVIVMVVFLGIGLVEMVGLIFTMCLYCHLRYESEDMM